jgi:hypothetical protein
MESFTLTRTSVEWLRKMKREFQRKPHPRPPAVRQVAHTGDGFPLRLAKPQTGEALYGSTPGISALCSIYAATPGLETAVETDIPVYPGQAMGIANTVDDTTYFLCGDVNGVLQFVGPLPGSGSATSGGKITVELPSDLALTDATKASCTVKATFSGGPALASTVTITNPPAKGGNYQWQAESTTQYVDAIWQGGSEYSICGVQPVSVTLVNNVAWSSPTLSEDKTTVYVQYLGGTSTSTVLTGNTACP